MEICGLTGIPALAGNRLSVWNYLSYRIFRGVALDRARVRLIKDVVLRILPKDNRVVLNSIVSP